MRTKLVYVLTCAPEATYIEQALMSVFSARHWNPEATIVLMVDNKTDALLTGKRGEILNYISEKVVVPFEDETLTPMYRSRWIKTQVRHMIDGDFLFVDCDTICCRSLSEVDSFICKIGAAGDNNTPFQADVSKIKTVKMVSVLCDISDEEYYYSSGVLCCKDTPEVHQFFKLWHQYWKEGVEDGLNIDQPAMAKANIEMQHIIQPIDNLFNCVLYTQNSQLYNAAILHIAQSPYMSLLFMPGVLAKIREVGITAWLKEMILYVHATYLPFDYLIKHSTLSQRKEWVRDISNVAKIYGQYVDETYSEWTFKIGIEKHIRGFYKAHLYRLGTCMWVLYKRIQLCKKNNLRANICAI